jgi:hypothetical protein
MVTPPAAVERCSTEAPSASVSEGGTLSLTNDHDRNVAANGAFDQMNRNGPVCQPTLGSTASSIGYSCRISG